MTIGVLRGEGMWQDFCGSHWVSTSLDRIKGVDILAIVFIFCIRKKTNCLDQRANDSQYLKR